MKYLKYTLLVLLFIVAGYFSVNLSWAASGGGGFPGGGGTPSTPTPVPSPTVVTSTSLVAPGSNPTITVPSGGATPVAVGDCLVGITFNTSTAPATGIGSALLSNFSAVGVDIQAFLRYITLQDVTAGHFTVNIGSGVALGGIYIRHVTCVPDAYSGGSAQSGSSTIQPPAATTNLTGDIDVNMSIINISGGSYSYTPPSGYTNQLNVAAVPSVATGIAIDTKLLGAPGSIQPGLSTVGGSSPTTGIMHAAIPNDAAPN